MSLRLKIIIILVVLLCIAAIIFVKLIYNQKPGTSVAGQKADLEMVSETLVKSFEIDENKANMQFLNKIILVSGHVYNVSNNKEDIAVYLKQKDEAAGVICSFDKSIITAGSLKPGDQVKIKGLCNGFLMDVVLNKCSLEK